MHHSSCLSAPHPVCDSDLLSGGHARSQCQPGPVGGVRYGYRAKKANTLTAMYRQSRDIGFGAEVKRRILLGTYALSAGYYDAYYKKAQQVRTFLPRDFLRGFARR